MIKSVNVGENHNRIVRPTDESTEVFNFTQGLNVLVGPNGSGKSTVLRTLAGFSSKKTYGTVGAVFGLSPLTYKSAIDKEPNSHIRYHDTYRMNAGIQSGIALPGITSEEIASASYSSHGEGARMQMYGMLGKYLREDLSGYSILLDEPDSGLDARAKIDVLQTIVMLSEKNQLIVVTHDVWLPFQAKNVIVFGNEPDYHRLVADVMATALDATGEIGVLDENVLGEAQEKLYKPLRKPKNAPSKTKEMTDVLRKPAKRVPVDDKDDHVPAPMAPPRNKENTNAKEGTEARRVSAEEGVV